MTKKTYGNTRLLERYLADPAGVRAEIALKAREERSKTMHAIASGICKALRFALWPAESYARQPRRMHQLY